jgi:hypothetical protein
VFGLLCSAGKRLEESAGAIPRILGRRKAKKGGVVPALSAFLPASRFAFLVRGSSFFHFDLSISVVENRKENREETLLPVGFPPILEL